MAHDLSVYRSDLPDIDDWYAGDSRTIAFTIERDGTAVDISDAEVEWRLFRRAYETGDDAAVLTGDDSDVEIVTDSRVDTEDGELEIRLDPEATAELWGEYFHRLIVTQADDSVASWRGRVVLEA